MPAAVIHCPICGRRQENGARYCPNCGKSVPSSPPPRTSPPTRIVAAVVLVVVAVLIIGGITSSIMAEQARAQQAARQQQEDAAKAREARLAQTLASLKAANPTGWIGRYPGDNNSLPVNARLSLCDVRGLNFTRTDGSDSLSVNVSLTGYRSDPQAPKVYVALYDETGRLLARSAIVAFTNAELKQGETREVEDNMDYPQTGTPMFAGVDEGVFAEVASSSSQTAASPAPTVLDGAERARREVQAAQERWHQDSSNAGGGDGQAVTFNEDHYQQRIRSWVDWHNSLGDGNPSGDGDSVFHWPNNGDESSIQIDQGPRTYAKDLSLTGGDLKTIHDVDETIVTINAQTFFKARLDEGLSRDEAARCTVILQDPAGYTVTGRPSVSD